MEKTAGAYYDFSKWSSGKSESLLAGNVVYFKKATNNIPSFWTMGRVVSLKLRGDEFPKGAEDEYCSPSKSSGKKKIADRAMRSLVKPLYIEDSTWAEDMEEVEEVVKSSRNVKTEVESNMELGSKITLLLDKKLTCKKSCFQDLSPDLRQTEYMDVLSRSWDTVEKRSREMSKYDHVFWTGWFLISPPDWW